MPFLTDPSDEHGGEGWIQKVNGKERLTRESGRVLKAKFDGFNSLFAPMHATLSAASVPDPALRKQLMVFPTRTLLPRYTDFYVKYSKLQFSKKHMEKYLRYTPDTLRTLIGQSFSGYHGSQRLS